MGFFKTFIFIFLLYWMFTSTSSMVGVRSIYEILCVVLLFTGAVIGLLAFFMMAGNTSYMSVVASYSLLIVGTSLLFGYTLHNLYNINKNVLDKILGQVPSWLETPETSFSAVAVSRRNGANSPMIPIQKFISEILTQLVDAK